MIKKIIFKIFKIYKVIAIFVFSIFIVYFSTTKIIYLFEKNTEISIREEAGKKYNVYEISFITNSEHFNHQDNQKNDEGFYLFGYDIIHKNEIFIFFPKLKHKSSKIIKWPFENSFKEMTKPISNYSEEFDIYTKYIPRNLIDLYQKDSKNEYIRKQFDEIPDDVSYILRYGFWKIIEINGEIKIYGPGFNELKKKEGV